MLFLVFHFISTSEALAYLFSRFIIFPGRGREYNFKHGSHANVSLGCFCSVPAIVEQNKISLSGLDGAVLDPCRSASRSKSYYNDRLCLEIRGIFGDFLAK